MTELQQFINGAVTDGVGDLPWLAHLADLPSDQLANQYRFEQQLALQLTELALPEDISSAAAFQGWCTACQTTTTFSFNWPDDGDINWRETLRCAHCQLINRWRSAAAVGLDAIDSSDPEHSVYLTEKLTPLYGWFSQHVPNLVGSEFCSPDTLSGSTCLSDESVYRHEDVTQLSFADNAHSHILTFDVLEHVPDYLAGLAEFFRCLRVGGSLIVSVPFDIKGQQNVVRARVTATGKIEHLLEPEYHGDPVNAQGILSFYTFGWQFLEDLRRCGFTNVRLQLVWDPGKGYLSLGQCFIYAQKPPKS